MSGLLCDIDGTLASNRWRQIHVETSPKDWRTFFFLASWDAPIEPVAQALRDARCAGRLIALVSGRPEEWRGQTLEWLQRNNIPYDRLCMRPNDDRRDDIHLKRQVFEECLSDVEITEAYEDRPDLATLWEEFGVEVHLVEDPALPPCPGSDMEEAVVEPSA